MRFAYSTYQLPMVELCEALRMIAGIGYEGVEICVGPRHVDVGEMEGRAREVGQLLGELGLELVALFLTGHLLAADEEEFRGTAELLRRCAGIWREMGGGGDAVLAMGIGGRSEQWDELRPRLVEQLRRYGDVAEREGFVVACEAHFGAAVDRSERAVWLMEQVGHPRVGLHFDIVHMFLAGEDEAEAVRRLLPYTVHTHVTDAVRDESGFRLVPVGRGQLDLAKYLRAMADGGWGKPLTVEVSMMVWGREDYRPREVAEESLRALREAAERAGVG